MQHVAAAAVFPIRFKEAFVRTHRDPVEVLGHKGDNAFVAGVFVIRLHQEEDEHIRPNVDRLFGVRIARAEVTVGALAL